MSSAAPGMLYRPLLLSLLALLLAACTTVPEESTEPEAGGQPSWVTQPPRTGSVIYGSGGSPLGDNQAATQSRARQAATADLMTGLRVRIMAETRSEVTEANGDVSRLYAQSVTSRVDDIELDDVRLEDTWESQAGFLYVLVSLDTAQAAARLRQAYTDDLPLLSEPDAGTGPLWPEFVAWQRVMTVAGRQAARDELHQMFAGRTIDTDWASRYQALQGNWQALLDDIRLYPDMWDDTGRSNSTLLTGPWTERGLTLVDDPSAAQWTLRMATREAVQAVDNAQQVIVTLDATLIDEQDQVRWQHSSQQRGLAGSVDRARRQALERAAEAAAQAWVASLQP
ncbi:MAG: LPP20 family lipoprotein [Natronospirillum sp.]|uniref:hypothetical protein n=1 Tax=Natronospirillum sp. TaxID=2812955 RepID=UPI0025DE0F08|nr:hypothetical protein [Natronospirillum sp.]MCH8550439.1 LPP20 family lipoprotein [Natronospirillum sp.]